MSHPKFKECANLSSIDAGQIILAAQQIIHKTKSDAPNPIMLPIIPSVTSVSTATCKQAKSLLLNSFIDNISEPSIKIGLPYPSNLKIEKRTETSVFVSWDGPTAAISLNQSIDNESLATTLQDANEVSFQSYNIFLNHEIYAVINASEELSLLIDNVDLNVVSYFLY